MRKHFKTAVWSVAALLAGLLASNAYATDPCPASVLATPKGNALYLFFPTVADNTFPDYSSSASTSPLQPFNVADLDSAIGTTAQLRTRIFEMVRDDYCEFNVRVTSSTTLPSPSETRWQIQGLGSDSAGGLFGEAQAVDTNDADAQDYSRVWADSFGDTYGGAGGALNGANSTLQRWATAIAGTSAHEAAHNYGAAHGHSAPRAGSSEDEQNNHIMATGSTGLTGEIRASRDRHFSDTEYEILGHNVGLNVKTLHNWDFINPNNTSANAMRIKLLSNASALTIGWWYNGSTSPWSNPTVSDSGSTQAFQGVTYKVFNLDFTTAKAWSGGANGVVPAAGEFHTGATFNESDDVIVFKVELRDGAATLPLSPRIPGYSSGTADLASGDFNVNFFNTNAAAGDLIISNMEVRQLPRMLDINAMVSDAPAVDVRGLAVNTISSRRIEKMNLHDRWTLPIAKLNAKRHVDIVYGPGDCPPGSIGSGTKPQGAATRAAGAGDSDKGEVKYCHRGNALSLFPSTYTYIIATVVDPNAKHWDKVQKKFIVGPVQSKLFFQLAGFVPDFNHNGVDDLIDIRIGSSVDDNHNGVPDESEPPGGRCPCNLSTINWLLVISVALLVVILLLVVVLVMRRR